MSSNPLYFLQGDSRAAGEILAFDWSTTPIGLPEHWPTALKIALGITLASKFPKALIWGSQLITFHNDAFRPILGDKPPAMGRPFSEVWADAWDQIRPFVERTYQGESVFIENFPMLTTRHGYDEEAHFTFCYSPVRDENGQIVGIMDTVFEVSETIVAQRQMQAVNHELAHRMQNMFAIVGSIASQTLRGSSSVEDAEVALQHRLVALGQAQKLLTASHRSEALVSEVIAFVREALGVPSSRVVIATPRIWLTERQALSLSLAVNELMTNAVKYGALSLPDGEVFIDCAVDGTSTGQFTFSWRESGGPAVSAPTRKGFGSTLLERIVPLDFQGDAQLLYEVGGVFYQLTTDKRAI